MQKGFQESNEIKSSVPFSDLKGHEEFGKFPGENYEIIGGGGDIYQSGNNEDYIIRGISAKSNYKEIWENPQEVIDYAQKLRIDFIELEKVYGVRIAPTTFVPAKPHSEFLELFEVTEKIEGKNLEKIIEESGQDLEEVRQRMTYLFQSLCNYVLAKFSEKKKIMGDIYRSRQYVFGTRKASLAKELYLVDPDPHYINLENLTSGRFYTEYLNVIIEISIDLMKLEKIVHLDLRETKLKLREKYLELRGLVPEDQRKPYHSKQEAKLEEFLNR
jgi:hypothetical protein